ncbi:MAG: tRNA (adenosine(37)-N6)-threonylcarbamoyltransferase complex dimerization subunit type 1 TsaB [Gammaproteobacteria bacterium]|nr:tRNA (adenosine(37)-N6)-threonylcarbamoyltransferase complex dimerization subunit type 1 TsaB [Gammaproteobacteria bacterium]MBA3732301.1 tRNA (adenosine(37)-N6)-threonylcarbamoyltransferase complex dimerization subunit type 1 TsaB [Gammaproteobacteria bacterium]
MKLLAVETATEGCSAALAIDGEIVTRFEIAPRRHAELILPMCESLLVQAEIKLSQLDAIAFGRGPGSFTGVRIAAGIAQGLAFGLDLPVVPVSTLAALAQEIMTEVGKKNVLAALDARMGEIYWGCYRRDEQGSAQLIGAEHVSKAGDVAVADHTWYGAGSGWSAYGDTLTQRLASSLERYDGDRLPRAVYIAKLAKIAFTQGLAVAAEQAQPVYLRNNVAKKSHEL